MAAASVEHARENADLTWHIRTDIDGRVEAAAVERLDERRLEVAVGGQVFGLREQAGAGLAAVQQAQLVPASERGLHDVPADEPGATDHEHAHVATLCQPADL